MVNYDFFLIQFLGPMELDMKESGKIIKHMGKENSFMSTGMYLKVAFNYKNQVNGRTIRLTVTESICTLMVQNIKATGKMTCKMDMVWKSGILLIITFLNILPLK